MEHEAAFGPWLHQKRRALDLTQEALAQKISCSAATIRKLEAELRRPSAAIVARLADFLDIHEDERVAFLRFARKGWSAHAPAVTAPGEPQPWQIPVARGNVPADLTEILGREQELEDARRFIEQGSSRLLTLTGTGGTGKTRLALEVAAGLVGHFTDGVFFVSLARITDPALVPAAIAQTLGVRQTDEQTLTASLQAFLRERHLLLLLDNFEHVIAAAPIVSELLAASPKLTALVTSRERLRLRGEHEFPVPPLALPQPHAPASDLLANAAVKVFIERALEVSRVFTITRDNAQVIAEICVRLDGLPLAIELAAGRSKLFSPCAILTRLEDRFALLIGGARDLPSRQRTLHATISWSYELLGDSEKELFRRLALFVGGVTLDAAAAVCSASADLDVLAGLESMVEKNLLRQQEGAGGEPRFFMLETIREYARQRLEESGEVEEMCRRHADYFMALALEAEPRLRAKEQGLWLRRLDEEHDNLRAALRWLVDSGAVECAPRLAGALGEFWYLHGHLKEGQQWVAEVLPMADKASLPVRAGLLLQACNLAWKQRDLDAADELARQCLTIVRELNDLKAMADAFHTIGNVAMERADADAAREFYQEALRLRSAQPDPQGMSVSLNGLGESARLQGKFDRAAAYYERSLALAREIGDLHRGGIALHNLGQLALAARDHDTAAAHFTEGLIQHGEIGELCGIATQFAGLAAVAAMQGQAERAARLFGSAARLFEQFGTHLDIADRESYDRGLAAARAGLSDAHFQKGWHAGRNTPLPEAIRYALDKDRSTVSL